MNDHDIRKLFFEKSGYDSKSEKRSKMMNRGDIFGISGIQTSGEYVFQEVGIQEGGVIADIVIIDLRAHSGVGMIAGYEIKSDEDNFRRFPKQARAYAQVFDFNSLIVGRSFDASVCPAGWGCSVASPGELEFRQEATRNPSSVYELVRLIWRAEAYALLKRHGLGKRMSGASRGRMWARLCEGVDTCVLRSEILRTITERRGWK